MKITNNLCLLTKNSQTSVLDVQNKTAEICVGAGEHIDMAALVFSGDVFVRVVLAGVGASCDLKAVYLMNDAHQCHIRFDVVHESGETFSRQTVKGIVTDTGRATFEGTIHIPPKSQKCDAAQNHRAVLLTDTGLVTAVPELEIFADDVKCAHGSAIGPLPDEHLFYLMSRGIPKETAQKLLLHSFVNDVVVPEFSEDVMNWMNQHV